MCVVSDGPKNGCGDTGCGQELCDGATGTYKACSNANTNVRCNPNNANQRQVCGPNGVFIAQECTSTQWCSGSGVCKARDGEVCTGAAECATGVCNQFYTDADGDTYRANNTLKSFCGTTKVGYVLKSAANAATDCANGDNNEFAHPGALEVCDGVDNDCDTLVDHDDDATLILGGGSESKLLASGFDESIAWSGSNYGIAYSGSGTKYRFAAVNQANAKAFADVEVAPNGRGGVIGWDGTKFVLFVSNNGGSGKSLTQFNGTTAGVVTAGSPASFGAPTLEGLFAMSVSRMNNSGLYLTGTGVEVTNYTHTSFGYVLNATKQGVETGAMTSDAEALQVAASGSTYGLVWQYWDGSFQQLLFSPRDSEGAALRTPPVQLDGIYGAIPKIAATPTGGFIIAWYSQDSKDQFLKVQELAANGDTVCGPISKNLGAKDVSASTVGDIVPTKRGFLLSHSSPAGIRLQEVLTGCKFAANPYTLDSGATPRISAGSAGYMLTWSNANSIYTKNLGPNICD